MHDVIVVGAGSAGCIVAGELAAAGVNVLLLEHGDPAEAHPETLHADGYKYAFINDHLMHERFTTKQKHAGGRRWFVGTGRGMGGSGSINGMVYTRGDKLDYAEWPEGWRWDDLTPAFEAIEARLKVKPRAKTEFTECAIAAAEQAGFQRKLDLNDGSLKGFLGYEHMAYDGDRRRSSYVSYLQNAALPSLTIVTSAAVERLEVVDARVTGVTYVHNGQRARADAAEVVLCAGALETPKLLMLSGIGPAEHLKSLGIDVVLDAPEIGANLHDHPNVTLFHLAKKEPDANYPMLYGFHRANDALPLPKEQADTCYVLYTGRSSLHQATMRMLPTILLPLFLYASLKGVLRTIADWVMRIPPMPTFIKRLWGVVVILGKPMSRGSIRLASKDPRVPAKIDPNYFADARDLDALVKGCAIGHKIAEGMTEFGNTRIGGARKKKLEKWIRGNAMTTYHFCGTARMGSDEKAPVDTSLKLRGIEGLRVGDASVVPSVPVSAMNAPSMLIGYKTAQAILEERACRSRSSLQSA